MAVAVKYPTTKEQRALDTLINIGLLTPKRIKRSGLTLKYYDPKGELLVLRKVLKNGNIQYEVYKVAKAQFTDDLNYDQIPKLLIVETTDSRINLEFYIPGVWENRLAKLAEDIHNGKDKELPKIRRPTKRTPNGAPG